MIVCDLGKYESPEDRPSEEQLGGGKIHLVLQGEKLCGAFTSIKFERQSKNSNRRDYWLLIKSRDEYADPSWDIQSPRFDYSVLTLRSLEEIRDGKPIKHRSAQRRV